MVLTHTGTFCCNDKPSNDDLHAPRSSLRLLHQSPKRSARDYAKLKCCVSEMEKSWNTVDKGMYDDEGGCVQVVTWHDCRIGVGQKVI